MRAYTSSKLTDTSHHQYGLKKGIKPIPKNNSKTDHEHQLVTMDSG